MEFLALFDAPDPCDAYSRTTSVRPQQALALLNSELALRQGRLLARKLTARLSVANGGEAVSENDGFIALAFERILSRPPSREELRVSQEFLIEQTQLFRTQPPPAADDGAADGQLKDAPAKDVPPKDTVLPSANPATRARESLVHALFSHNDFVTVR